MTEEQVLKNFKHPLKKISDFNNLKMILDHVEYIGRDDYLEHSARIFKDAFIHVISTGRMAPYVENLMYSRTIKWLVKLVVENEVTCIHDASKVIGKKIDNLTGKKKKVKQAKRVTVINLVECPHCFHENTYYFEKKSSYVKKCSKCSRPIRVRI